MKAMLDNMRYAARNKEMTTIGGGYFMHQEMTEFLKNYDALLAALELATATVELHTPNGAQSQPKWLTDQYSNIDYRAIATNARAAIARATGAA